MIGSFSLWRKRCKVQSKGTEVEVMKVASSTDVIVSRFRRFVTRNYGNDTLTGEKKFLKKTTTTQMKECYFMGLLL